MVVKTKTTLQDTLVSKLAHLTTSQLDHGEKEAAAAPTTSPALNIQPPSPFVASDPSLVNICSGSSGSKVLFATDEWFACADNLLRDEPPLFDPQLFCEQGKVMDGWESRRRREAGHDWCLISLSQRGIIRGIELDTAHFTGNHVPNIAIQVADLGVKQTTNLVSTLPGAVERLIYGGQQGVGHDPLEVNEAANACVDGIQWTTVLPKTPLKPGYEETRMHYYTLQQPIAATHVKLMYFPDGGVARLKLWAKNTSTTIQASQKNTPKVSVTKTCTIVPHSCTGTPPPSRLGYQYPELSSLTNGGKGIACSNKHYGEPHLLLQESLGKDMGSGWETARHPSRPGVLVKDAKGLTDSPLNDWCIIKLGKPCMDGIARVILDTRHFKGNFPESVLVEACFAERGTTDDDVVVQHHADWFCVVARTRMTADAEHVFEKDLQQLENATRAVTHVRVSMFPDGGLSRVRIYGPPAEDAVVQQSNL